MSQLTIQQAFDLAVRHYQSGRFADGEALCREIVAAQPNHADALHLLGVIADRTGRFELAIDLLRQAIAVAPANPFYPYNLAGFLQSRGQLDQAIQLYQRALELKPQFPEACHNLGDAWAAKGRWDEAIDCYQRGISLRPDVPEMHNNLGDAWRRRGQLEQAVESYRRAIAIRPDFPLPYNHLGNVLRMRGQGDDAIGCFQRALEIKADFFEARYNLGNTLRENGQMEQSIACFRRAIELKPDFVKAHSNLVYAILFDPKYDAAAISAELKHWNDRHAEPLAALIQPYSNDRDPDRRLRIGYVSPDLRDHVIGRNLLPLVRHHDRGQFQVICYYNDVRRDAITALFQQHADGWRNIAEMSDEQAANQIRRDGIDILVDLTLHLDGSKLLTFARKPAPVQVTFAGYPGSTGLRAMDYRLSDPYLDPPGMDASVYSEGTIRLPKSFWCYDPRPLESDEVPEVAPLPALTAGNVTFGCLNNFCKVNDLVLGLWRRVLDGVENSRLMMLAPPGSCRQHIRDIAGDRVDFVTGRSRRNYLKSYRGIDLGLDTFPYNGHTTTLDSLWMGVPVVTRIGKTVVGRAGWSQLCNIGLGELAAESDEQFVRIAVDLARDPVRLGALRANLRQRMLRSPLMDGEGFARGIEAAYRQMWGNWCNR